MPQPALGEDFIPLGEDFEEIPSTPSEELVVTPPLNGGKSNGIWDMLTSSVTDLPSRAARAISAPIRDFREKYAGENVAAAQQLGFLEGGIEGLGDYITDALNPVDMGLSLATSGSNIAAKHGMSTAVKGLDAVANVLSGAVAARGAGNVLSPDSSLAQRALGLAEIAGGVAGLRGGNKVSKIADQVISPEPLPVGPNEFRAPKELPSVEGIGGNTVSAQPPTSNIPVQARMGNTPPVGNSTRVSLKNPTPEMIKKAKAAGYDVTFENGKAYLTKSTTPVAPESLPVLETEVAKAGKPTPSRARLQANLRAAKPRYKDSKLEFDNDMDMALYIISNAKSRSIADKDYLKFVMENTGLDELGARQLGLQMRQTIKDAMQNATPGKPVKLNDFYYARQNANPTSPSVPPVMDGTGGNVPPVEPPPVKDDFVPNGSPGEHLGDVIDRKKDSPILEALGFTRSLQTVGDLSMPFRQGKMHIGTKAWRDAFKNQFAAGFSEDAFRMQQAAIRERPLFKQTFNQRTKKYEKSFAEQAGLKLTDLTDLNSREEALASTWAEVIPGVRASNRAATAFMNNLRADTFENLIKTYKVLEGKEPDLSLARSLADFVNSSTGRGDLGKMERAATVLNQTLFSPRLLKSRLDMMNPVRFMYAPEPVQKETIKAWLRLTGAALAMGEVSKAAGGRMGTDPTSSDFGKIILPGNKTRIDPWAGFQQFAVLATRLATGKRTSSTTGKEFDLDNPRGFNPPTRLSTVGDFARSKASPNAGLIMDMMNSMKDPTGRPLNFNSADPFQNTLMKQFIPLFFQQTNEIIQDDPENFEWVVPALFGEGVQSYEKPSYTPR